MKTFAQLLAIFCLSNISAFGALGASGGGGGHTGGGGGHVGGGAVHSGATPRGTAFLGHGYRGGGYYHGGYYYPFYPYWDFYYYGYPAYYDYDYPPPPEYAPPGGQVYSPSGPSYEELGRFWGRKLKQAGPAAHDEFLAFLQSDLLKAADAGRQLFQGGFMKAYGKDAGPLLNRALQEAKGSGQTARSSD